jgi:tRNA(Ile2) C34 agmatinyltransferase TiaS
MKPIKDVVLEEFEALALKGAKEIEAYFKYQGKDPAYFSKAKVGAGVIGAYARMRASESNRMAVEMMVARHAGALPKGA